MTFAPSRFICYFAKILVIGSVATAEATATQVASIPDSCAGQRCLRFPRANCFVSPRDSTIIWIVGRRVVSCKLLLSRDHCTRLIPATGDL